MMVADILVNRRFLQKAQLRNNLVFQTFLIKESRMDQKIFFRFNIGRVFDALRLDVFFVYI
jgi:hypothetical protein